MYENACYPSWPCCHQPQSLGQIATQVNKRRLKILLAEHRDEVFARLGSDLRDMGHQVYRATWANDMLRVSSRAKIDLIISNPALPDGSVWLTATKLQMCGVTTPIWLYAPRESTRDREWGKLIGIERIIYYHGDLFLLARRVADACRGVACGM